MSGELKCNDTHEECAKQKLMFLFFCFLITAP